MSKTSNPGHADAPATVFTQKLQRHIPNAGGELVEEISFREPRAADVMKIGNPVAVDLYAEPPRITFDDDKMGGMMEALSGIPKPMLGRMHPQDYVACCWGLSGFFLPAGLMQA